MVPTIGSFSLGSCSIAEEIRAAYREYTNTVSHEGTPISFESACFLWSLCEAISPKRILDLGSGFTSFVFRRYQSTAAPPPEVWSVDESLEWLEKTRMYLQSHSLPDDNLFSWDDFQRLEPGCFDLIMHDLGVISERPKIFEHMLTLREDTGVVIVDDLHYPWYRGEISRRIEQHSNLAGYSLKWLTLDRFLRYCLLVGRPPGQLKGVQT